MSTERYADLRRRGTTYVPSDEPGLVTALRRLAKADGLNVSTGRHGSSKDTRDQRRRRPWIVNLIDPADPTTIVTPDAR